MEMNYEMPTPCQKCGSTFDLNDGLGSEKWYPGTVICKDCGSKERDEIEDDDIIETANIELSNALYEFKERGWGKVSDDNKAVIIHLVSGSLLKERDELLEEAGKLVGNPGTNISVSCDVACMEWQEKYERWCNDR